MNTTDEVPSGYLTLRFWGLSGLFWLAFSFVTLGPGHVLWLSAGTSVAPLWQSVLIIGVPYWLVTPLLFHWAWLTTYKHGKGRGYWSRLFAVVLLVALVHMLLEMQLVYVPAEGFREKLAWGFGQIFPHLFKHGAILACGVIVTEQRRNELRRRELLHSQLRLLRSQLQPHFLFNTLQAIGSTARSDGDAAVRMTALLGDLLRQSLRERTADLVSLAEECALLDPYVELQRIRFGDRLRIDVDVPPELLGAGVPDMVLQPLVENALQHGIERRPGDGVVRIVARRSGDELTIDVIDDGDGGIPENAPDGIGLGNTRARLDALFGDRASLQLRSEKGAGTTVSVTMPYRETGRAA